MRGRRISKVQRIFYPSYFSLQVAWSTPLASCFRKRLWRSSTGSRRGLFSSMTYYYHKYCCANMIWCFKITKIEICDAIDSKTNKSGQLARTNVFKVYSKPNLNFSYFKFCSYLIRIRLWKNPNPKLQT